MFHKLQIGNMTWLQLEKTFQSKDFFCFNPCSLKTNFCLRWHQCTEMLNFTGKFKLSLASLSALKSLTLVHTGQHKCQTCISVKSVPILTNNIGQPIIQGWIHMELDLCLYYMRENKWSERKKSIWEKVFIPIAFHYIFIIATKKGSDKEKCIYVD